MSRHRGRRATDWTTNDWTVGPAPLAVGHDGERTLTATVVIPCKGAQTRLEAVLVALAAQSYPTHLFDVIVVDDGSDPPLDPSHPPQLRVRTIRPGEVSAGAGAARAAGWEASGASDVIAFIDADMLPEPQWLEAHLRWHHVRSDAAVVGFRRHVRRTTMSPEAVHAASSISALFDGEEYSEPEWIEQGWVENGDGLMGAGDLWRLVSSGNLSVGRRVYERSGGFDPDYWTEWGGEDNEFGYRLYIAGALIIPERAAMAWHLGLGTSHRSDTEAHRERSRVRLASRVPSDLLPRFQQLTPETPRHRIRLVVDEQPLGETLQLIDRLLTTLGGEIGIRVQLPPGRTDDIAFLELLAARDARVVVAETDDSIPPTWRWARYVGWLAADVWSAEGAARAFQALGEGDVGRLEVRRGDDLVGELMLNRLTDLRPDLAESVADRGAYRLSSLDEWCG